MMPSDDDSSEDHPDDEQGVDGHDRARQRVVERHMGADRNSTRGRFSSASSNPNGWVPRDSSQVQSAGEDGGSQPAVMEISGWTSVQPHHPTAVEFVIGFDNAELSFIGGMLKNCALSKESLCGSVDVIANSKVNESVSLIRGTCCAGL
jgi:hypothetical protein